jgi:hypothetical protein
MTKRVLLLTAALLFISSLALADELTVTVVGQTGIAADITAGPSGMVAGPANAVLVTDITTGKSFTLSDTFNASAGPSTSIHITPTNYTSFFSAGGANSVSVSNVVMGMMDPASEITAVLPGGAGSFSGEFDVSFFSPAILAEFGLSNAHVSPSGSVGITFVETGLSGQDLTGKIGGASTTVLTVTTVPEPATLLLWGSGLLSLVAVYQARQRSQR